MTVHRAFLVSLDPLAHKVSLARPVQWETRAIKVFKGFKVSLVSKVLKVILVILA
jgi:hypothetical protein